MRVEAIGLRLSKIEEDIRSYEKEMLSKATTDAAAKEYFENQITSLTAERNMLTAQSVQGEESVREQLAKMKQLVDSNAKAIDAAVAEGFSFFNPSSYVSTYLAAVGRAPKRIAAFTVLKYMRDLRKDTYVWPAVGDLSPKAQERRVKMYQVLRRKLQIADPGETDPKKAKDEEERQRILDYKWFTQVKEQALSNDSSPAIPGFQISLGELTSETLKNALQSSAS